MKKTVLLIVALLLTLSTLPSCGREPTNSDSRGPGTHCDDCYQTGYSDGYNDGESYGHSYGTISTYFSMGNVDAAFQSVLDGGSWYAFVEAYDLYIADIYDSDEVDLDLVFALDNADEHGHVTAAEKELLIATFGEDLFIRNNFPLIVSE